MAIPAGPAELTAEWLMTALAVGGQAGGAAVTSFTATPLADAKGFYGQVVRLHLAYDREQADLPRTLIAKFASINEEMRNRAAGAYEREVRFYQEVAGQAALPLAACYYAGIDAQTGLHVLLLEDLAPARSGSRVAGCSVAEADLALRTIAAFHAQWWENPATAAFVAQAGHRLPASMRELDTRLGARRADIRRRIFGSTPRTLIHRDYQLDNLVFGAPDGGKPFAVLDWQMVSRGRATWDAAYFLSENVTTAARRAEGMDLLRLYWQELAAHGVERYSFDECLLDYRYSLLQRFSALVSTIAAMPFSAEQRRLHVDVLLPRTLEAIEDAQALELIA